jgi:broad specificity phosphatase PhoE
MSGDGFKASAFLGLGVVAALAVARRWISGSGGPAPRQKESNVKRRMAALQALPRPVPALEARPAFWGGEPLGPGEKLVHFIRHGQGYHNQAQADWYAAGKSGEPYTLENDPSGRFEDAELTALGQRQARDLQARTASIAPELLVVSPMRRAILTGVTAFERHIKGEVVGLGAGGGSGKLPVLAREECHEIAGKHTCDRRLSKTRLTELYPMVDFSQVEAEEDPFWGDGTRREPLEEVAGRAAAFMAWLKGREETHVAVACHSTFLLSMFNGVLSMDKANAHLQKWFDTGEMRSVVVRWEEQ